MRVLTQQLELWAKLGCFAWSEPSLLAWAIVCDAGVEDWVLDFVLAGSTRSERSTDGISLSSATHNRKTLMTALRRTRRLSVSSGPGRGCDGG
jgi:hypothetical protein